MNTITCVFGVVAVIGLVIVCVVIIRPRAKIHAELKSKLFEGSIKIE